MASSLLEIKRYFGYEGKDGMAKFRQDWSRLSEADKADIRKGMEDGTLTY
jgi:hypothetical protein